MIRIRRVYDPAFEDEGLRVLVDRLWPRGVRKADLAMDLWAKDLAPSSELRQWYCHEPERFPEFSQRYREELRHALTPQHTVLAAALHGNVTLLYAARDPLLNQARVLQQVLMHRCAARARRSKAS
jgi:uncharacterized protein YeaO (DUF488 family)